MLKGMDAMKAKNQLDYLAKRSAKPISKLLDSAMANAQNNHRMPKDNLFIKNIIVDEGIKLKRGRPKGFGTISPIEKKTSHILIVLDEKVPGMKAEPKKEIREQKAEHHAKEEKPTFTKGAGKQESVKKGVFGGIKGLGKRFFRRKAV